MDMDCKKWNIQLLLHSTMSVRLTPCWIHGHTPPELRTNDC